MLATWGHILNPPFPKVPANATVGTPSKQDHRGLRLPRKEARFALNRKSPPGRGEQVRNGQWKKKPDYELTVSSEGPW